MPSESIARKLKSALHGKFSGGVRNPTARNCVPLVREREGGKKWWCMSMRSVVVIVMNAIERGTPTNFFLVPILRTDLGIHLPSETCQAGRLNSLHLSSFQLTNSPESD